jgi:hypothetical protein
MKKLLERIANDYDDADFGARLVKVICIDDELKLLVAIHFHDGIEPEVWEIQCTGVVHQSLSTGFAAEISESAKSALLLPYIEPQLSIMFAPNTMAPEALLGIVCSCCVETMGRADFITQFINGSATVSGIVSSAYGLLGRFPQSLAANILAALRVQPIQAHALPGFMPGSWNGSEYQPYPALRALNIGGSYVIAERFTAVPKDDSYY